MESDKPRVREKKVMYSTTLPKTLKESLHKTTLELQRKKADWVRSSLNYFLGLSEKEQENLILNTHKEMDTAHLRPFTTNLLEGQLSGLSKLSKALRRSKVEIVRTAIFVFLSKSAAEQEKEIKRTLSR